MNIVHPRLNRTDLRRFDSDLAETLWQGLGSPLVKPKDTTINELVTPNLTLEELVAWVDSQLHDDETNADDKRTPLPEWTELQEAA